MPLPRMSAVARFSMPCADTAPTDAESGLALAKTYYALSVYVPGCEDYPGNNFCDTGLGCGDGKTAAEAKVKAARDLKARFPVMQGPNQPQEISKAQWKQYCGKSSLNSTIDELGI